MPLNAVVPRLADIESVVGTLPTTVAIIIVAVRSTGRASLAHGLHVRRGKRDLPGGNALARPQPDAEPIEPGERAARHADAGSGRKRRR